jgi:hypothetical protein
MIFQSALLYHIRQIQRTVHPYRLRLCRNHHPILPLTKTQIPQKPSRHPSKMFEKTPHLDSNAPAKLKLDQSATTTPNMKAAVAAAATCTCRPQAQTLFRKTLQSSISSSTRFSRYCTFVLRASQPLARPILYRLSFFLWLSTRSRRGFSGRCCRVVCVQL